MISLMLRIDKPSELSQKLLLYNVQQRARPQFEQKIKRAIRARGNTEEAKKKFTIRNPVLDKDEYIQPPYWLWPKVITTIIILSFMVSKVIYTNCYCIKCPKHVCNHGLTGPPTPTPTPLQFLCLFVWHAYAILSPGIVYM